MSRYVVSRKFLFQAIGLIVLFLTQQLIYAQGMMATPEERSKRLKEQISLTDEQVTQVTKIFESAQQEMMQKRDSLQGDRAAMRSAMMEMVSKTDKAIEKILTAEQKKKYEELKKERRQQLQQRRSDRKGN